MSENQVSQYGEIGQFATKAVIVAVLVAATGWVLLDQLDSVIGARIDELNAQIHAATRVGGAAFWSRLETNVERAADPSNDLSPERKAKLAAAIHTLVERWGPLVVATSTDIAMQNAHDPGAEKK